MAGEDITPNEKLFLKTSVNLYRLDVEKLMRKGYSVSDAVRELVHNLVENDVDDVFFSFRKTGTTSSLEFIDRKIAEADSAIDTLYQERAILQEQRKWIMDNLEILNRQQQEQQKWNRIMKIGEFLDTVMARDGYKLTSIIDLPETKEMEELNPGWDVAQYVEVKRRLMGIIP